MAWRQSYSACAPSDAPGPGYPGLKVNRGNNFAWIKVLSIACLLFSLGLLMLKTEEQ